MFFKNGDEDAFSFLYKHYWEKVYGFTRLYLVSSEDIAEVVQEVFIKLWEARHLIDEEQPFEGFLFIITRNMIFNYSRKKLNYSFLKVTVLQAMEQEYEDQHRMYGYMLQFFQQHMLLIEEQYESQKQ